MKKRTKKKSTETAKALPNDVCGVSGKKLKSREFVEDSDSSGEEGGERERDKENVQDKGSRKKKVRMVRRALFLVKCGCGFVHVMMVEKAYIVSGPDQSKMAASKGITEICKRNTNTIKTFTLDFIINLLRYLKNVAFNRENNLEKFYNLTPQPI